MGATAPTVFVVDDTPEIRTALTRLLGAVGYEVRAFESAEHFLEEHDAEVPGCLLLDISLPGLSGIELQQQLVSSQCGCPIVFITGVADIQTSVHAMKEGAIDFLTKPIDDARLFAAVGQALRRDAEQRKERAIRRAFDERLQTLTPRERDVMELVTRGRLNKQIAWDLGIGEKTVKVHRKHVMSKMAVRSVADLVRLSARLGMCRPIKTSASDFTVPAALRMSLGARGSTPSAT
jgi:FixJ family two-component response regulator